MKSTEQEVMSWVMPIVFLAFIAMVGLLTNSSAQWDAATAKKIGQYSSFRRVTASSTTPGIMFDMDPQRLDGMCFNNSAYTIWRGSVSASQNGTTHTMILNGFPLFSSATYRLEGVLTPAEYFVCDQGVATCEVRCQDGRVR